MSHKRPARSFPEDVLRRPWLYEAISRSDAEGARPWEPVVVVHGPGTGRHGVWFQEGHGPRLGRGADDLQQLRYYRRRKAGAGTGGTGAGAATADLVRQLENELEAMKPPPVPRPEVLRSDISIRLVDDDTGEAIAGVRLEVVDRGRRLARERTGPGGQVQVPDVPRKTRFDVVFPRQDSKKAPRR